MRISEGEIRTLPEAGIDWSWLPDHLELAIDLVSLEPLEPQVIQRRSHSLLNHILHRGPVDVSLHHVQLGVAQNLFKHEDIAAPVDEESGRIRMAAEMRVQSAELRPFCPSA